VAREREIVLRTIYQMTEAQFRQYWISKVFRAEAASGPRIVYSNEEALDWSARCQGPSVSSMSRKSPKGLKVLRVDGRLPGETRVSAALPESLTSTASGRRRFDARDLAWISESLRNVEERPRPKNRLTIRSFEASPFWTTQCSARAS